MTQQPEWGAPNQQGFPPPQDQQAAGPGQSLPQAPPVPTGFGYGEYGGQAGVWPGMYLDQESGLTLPEGTQLAGVGRRIGAFFLAIPLLIITLGIGYIVWGLIIWGRGQTPALQVLGMRVWVPQEQRVATFWRMALREIVGRICDSILGIFTELTSFILMCTGRERKALHDWVASTVVLHDPNKVLPK